MNPSATQTTVRQNCFEMVNSRRRELGLTPIADHFYSKFESLPKVQNQAAYAASVLGREFEAVTDGIANDGDIILAKHPNHVLLLVGDADGGCQMFNKSNPSTPKYYADARKVLGMMGCEVKFYR